MFVFVNFAKNVSGMLFKCLTQEFITVAIVLFLSGIIGGLVAYAINSERKWKSSECARGLIFGIIASFLFFVLAAIAFEPVFMLADRSLDLPVAACCSFVSSMLAVHLAYKPLMKFQIRRKQHEPPLKVKRD